MAGRPTGTPNKSKTRLMSMLREEYGDDFDPIMKMAKNATVLQDIADAAIRGYEQTVKDDQLNPQVRIIRDSAQEAITAWEKIAKFTVPQLKAIEVSGDQDNPLAVTEIVKTVVYPEQK